MTIEIGQTGFMIWEFDLLCLAVLIIGIIWYKIRRSHNLNKPSRCEDV